MCALPLRRGATDPRCLSGNDDVRRDRDTRMVGPHGEAHPARTGVHRERTPGWCCCCSPVRNRLTVPERPVSKFCQTTMAVTSQARVVDAHSPSGEKPCAMRSSTECTAPGAEEYSHNGPSNALPEAVSMPAHNPSPRVQTGPSRRRSSRTSVVPHSTIRACTDRRHWHAGARRTLQREGPAAAAETSRCEVFMPGTSCRVPFSLPERRFVVRGANDSRGPQASACASDPGHPLGRLSPTGALPGSAFVWR